MPDFNMHCFMLAWAKPTTENGVYEMMRKSVHSNTFRFIRRVKKYAQITMINFCDKANALGAPRQSLLVCRIS